MIQFVNQQLPAFFIASFLGDIARDFGCADDFAPRVLERRDGQRDVEKTPVLAHAHGLIGSNMVTSPNAGEDFRLFVLAIRWNQNADRPAYGFLCFIPEQAFCAPVPGLNDPEGVLADDRVVGEFHDRGETAGILFGLFSLGNIDQHVDRANEFAFGIMQWRRVGDKGDARTIRPFGDSFHAPNRPILFEGHGHRTLVVGQRRPIRIVETPGDTPFVSRSRRAACHVDRSLVEKRDLSLGVRRIDGGWKRLKQLSHVAFALKDPILHPLGFGHILDHPNSIAELCRRHPVTQEL